MTKDEFLNLRQIALDKLFPKESEPIVELIDEIVQGEQNRCASCYNWVGGDIISTVGYNRFSEYPKTFVLCDKCYKGVPLVGDELKQLETNMHPYLGKETK